MIPEELSSHLERAGAIITPLNFTTTHVHVPGADHEYRLHGEEGMYEDGEGGWETHSYPTRGEVKDTGTSDDTYSPYSLSGVPYGPRLWVDPSTIASNIAFGRRDHYISGHQITTTQHYTGEGLRRVIHLNVKNGPSLFFTDNPVHLGKRDVIPLDETAKALHEKTMNTGEETPAHMLIDHILENYYHSSPGKYSKIYGKAMRVSAKATE